MPMPVMSQPSRMAPGDAPRDMSEGKLKTPPPIMDPKTSAVRGNRVSFGADSVDMFVVAVAVVMAHLRYGTVASFGDLSRSLD